MFFFATVSRFSGWWQMLRWGDKYSDRSGYVCKQEAECVCAFLRVEQDCDKFQSKSLVSATALVSEQSDCLCVMEPRNAELSHGTCAEQDVACQAGSI